MRKSHILVVEDERLVAIDLAESLDRLGYGVLGIADSTDIAIAKSRELNPDLVLMDIQLIGRGDGIQAAAFIRRNLEIPIVFVTAHADSTTLERAATADPYGYIVKPFEDHDLHATVETALHRAKAEAKLRKL